MRGRRGSQGMRKNVPVSLSPSCFSTPAKDHHHPGSCRHMASLHDTKSIRFSAANGGGTARSPFPTQGTACSPTTDSRRREGSSTATTSPVTRQPCRHRGENNASNKQCSSKLRQHSHHLACHAPALKTEAGVIVVTQVGSIADAAETLRAAILAPHLPALQAGTVGTYCLFRCATHRSCKSDMPTLQTMV